MSIKKYIKAVIRATREKKIIPIESPILESNLLNNKVAFISGGSGGIGMAIAKSLLESKCKVIIGGTNPEKLTNCEAKLKKYSNNVRTILFDLTQISNFNKVINKFADSFGKIDIYINAAGVHIENVNFWTVTPEQFDNVIDIDLKGAYFSCIAMAKYWKKNKVKGHILLISSSRSTEPAWSPYGISKLGINGMTKGLAQVLIREGIIVNSIAPGSTATPLLGIKEGDSIYTDDNKFHRMIMPSEVAIYAKLLVSDAGNMLTGETIYVSAGRGIWDIR